MWSHWEGKGLVWNTKSKCFKLWFERQIHQGKRKEANVYNKAIKQEVHS